MTVEFGSQVKPIKGWDDFVTWLVENFGAMTVGSLFEIGQRGIVVYAADDPVVCAQIVKLEDDVLWLRLSDEMLGTPLLANHSAGLLPLDVWQREDTFEDCTEGFLFSADHRLVAEACASWFRDRRGYDVPDTLDCGYETVDRLPRNGQRKPPRPPRDQKMLEDCRGLAEQFLVGRFEDVRWVEKRLLAFSLEGNDFQVIVRRKKRLMNVVVELGLGWTDQLTAEACADLEGRVPPVAILAMEESVFLMVGFAVTETVLADLENSIELLSRIVRSVECRSTVRDLQNEEVQSFGEWRLDWGLFEDE